MARTIIRTTYSDDDLDKRINDLDKRITKLSKYFNAGKRESNEQGVSDRTKDVISAYLKSKFDGNANNEHNDYVNDYIRKICEKARENMEASSKGTYSKPYSTRRFDYSKSYFLQTMCNEIDFFKEDSQQIGRSFGPYTFCGWVKSKSEIKNGFFHSKPNDCDTYFSTQRKCLVIYETTEERFNYVPLLTPNKDNKEFVKSSLDILCEHLINKGVPSTGDEFGYLTVDFCGLHNSYFEYCKKNAVDMSTRKPYHVDILYNFVFADISYIQVNCIKVWRYDTHYPLDYEILNIKAKAPALVYKGIDVDHKEDVFGNVYFNKETKKYEMFDGYFWQEIKYEDERKSHELDVLPNMDVDKIEQYNYANMFNYQQEQPTLFEENRVYLLKHESLDGSEQQEKTYLLVKYIHDIFGIVLDCLVVKQLSGNNEKIFTLTKSDCALLEIEYQSGLQILPSQLNWEQVKENDDSTKDSECDYIKNKPNIYNQPNKEGKNYNVVKTKYGDIELPPWGI